jgi:ribokinase
MKVLNIGSLNYDYVYSVRHILKPGETISSTKMETFCGGKGLNQSVSLARAGAQVYHAGMLGSDGKVLLDTCKENNIDISNIRTIDGKSGHTIIQVDENGQNCILLHGGSNRNLTKEYVDDVLNCFESGDWLLLQNEVNLLSYIINKAYDKGLKIALNPSPFDEAINECDLSKISLFLLNEIEGEQITGKSKAKEILDYMIGLYEEARIVLTLGSKGVIYRDKRLECVHGIYKVNVVDTTAAGDTFTGYFMSSLANNLSVKEALEISSKASAIAVSRPGATTSIPYMKEVLEVKLELL